MTEGALNAALVPAWLRVRETEGAVAAAAFAGRVLGTVSAALIAVALLIGLLMPLVDGGAGAGLCRTPTLQLAVDDARLMLPYLAFAGPVTVMMALLNAQAPLRADGVLAAAVQHRADRGDGRAARAGGRMRPTPR